MRSKHGTDSCGRDVERRTDGFYDEQVLHERKKQTKPEKNKMKLKEMEPETEANETNRSRIVSPQEWEAARQQLLVKEKALTRARDALAAERRRMPWLAVKKK